MEVEKPALYVSQGTQCINEVVPTKELEQKRGGGGVPFDGIMASF
jgi:hypothetical protein